MENCLVSGSRIAYGIYGEGRPVVLLHGTPSSSLIWRNIVPYLVSAGFKIHLFDLLGYGLSERPWDPSIDTSISGQVPILLGLLSHWKLSSAHIIAHDIGGGVAQRLAILHPSRVRTLTMIDVVSFDSYPSARTRQQMQSGLESLVKANGEEHQAHFREWLLSAVQDKEKFVGSSLDTYLGYISGAVGQPSLFQHQIRHYDSKHTMEVAGRYAELGNGPVKLIWGREDAWQVLSWAERLKAAIPGAELDVVEGAGHFSLEDRPEKIAELVLEFLERHAERESPQT